MTNNALIRLMTWLSPSYPVGAYTYSHGLERAVELEEITNIENAYDWLKNIVKYGTGQSDCALLHMSYKAMHENNPQALINVAEYAAAFCGTKELALESESQGLAFLKITQKSWPCKTLQTFTQIWSGPICYPVIVGVTAAGHKIDVQDTAIAYLHAFSANLVSALQRLVPLGQTDGQRLIAQLEPIIIETAKSSLTIDLKDLSNACLRVDMMSMQHETQHTRLFRS